MTQARRHAASPARRHQPAATPQQRPARAPASHHHRFPDLHATRPPTQQCASEQNDPIRALKMAITESPRASISAEVCALIWPMTVLPYRILR